MSIQKLPAAASLENLKKQAKSLLKSVRAGDDTALMRVGPYFGDPTAIGLQQAQLVIAREYGFSSWTKLKTHIGRGASDVETGEQRANRFLDLVTMVYQQVPDRGPARFAKAAELLEAHPEILDENIYTAAAAGDVTRIDRWLKDDPDALDRQGGFFNWEPLMYAAYSRLPGVSTLDAGVRLLEYGANPNAYFMWGGQYKFTALTGVFGEGEGGPIVYPEHPDMVAFARALLDRGANANDSQAAYNRCFRPDNTCLELLLEYGLAGDDKNNWLLVEDDRLVPHPSETMHFHLIQAIHRGFVDRAKLLIEHGVDVDKPDDTYETRSKGKTPYEAALLLGQNEIAELLLAAGALVAELSPLDTFEAACMAGDEAQARALLAADPELSSAVAPRHRALLCDAVKLGNRDALATMIALDFELNDNSGRPPLHEAAWHGDVEILNMLLDAGADATLRDPEHFGPPIGFAQYAEQDGAVALLDEQKMDIFTAAARGKTNQISARLAEDPAQLNMRFVDIRPNKTRPCEGDWMTPIVYAVLNGKINAVRFLLEHGADVDVNDGADRSLINLARAQDNADILALIEGQLGS